MKVIFTFNLNGLTKILPKDLKNRATFLNILNSNTEDNCTMAYMWLFIQYNLLIRLKSKNQINIRKAWPGESGSGMYALLNCMLICGKNLPTLSRTVLWVFSNGTFHPALRWWRFFVQIPDEQQVQIGKNLSSGEGAEYNVFLRYQRISFLYPFLLHWMNYLKASFYK